MSDLAWSIVALILGAGITGAWGMQQWLYFTGRLEKKYIKIRREIWENEDRLKQKDRARTIQKLAYERMNSIPPKLQRMEREILVKYETLLKIWDIASHIEENA